MNQKSTLNKFSRYLLLIGFCFTNYPYGAKVNPIDSLRNALSLTKTDSVKVEILIAMGYKNNDDFLEHVNAALNLAQKSGYKKGFASAHLALGKYYYRKENFSISLLHCITAYNHAKEINNYNLMSDGCLYIGYNNYVSQPDVSLKYYLKSLEYSKLARNPALVAYGYSAIGNIYETWNDAQNALLYYQLSLKIRRRLDQPMELASSLIETARAYNRLSEYDKSNDLIYEGLKIAEQREGNAQNLVYLYEMVGHDCAGRLKNYKMALDFFLKSYKIANENKLNNNSSKKPIAEMYLKLGDHKNAAAYFKSYNDVLEANQKKVSFEGLKTQNILKQELENEKIIANKAEAKLKEMNFQKQLNVRKLFVAGILVLLILIFFIYRNNRLKEKMNINLEEMVKKRTAEMDIMNRKLKLSEKQLTETNKELESFIYCTSHDLKSPIASSRGLIALAINSEKPADVWGYLKMIQGSLDKLDGVLVTLYEVSIIRKGVVELKSIDIEKILQNLISSFNGYSNFDRIKFTVKNKLKISFVSDEILTQTILRNILENAVKYSQLGIANPFVNIVISCDQNYNVIEISDNGVGIPKEHHEKIFDVFFRANTGTKGSGLGLYIAKNAIDKLGGGIELVSSKPHKGTTFNLYFPIN